MKLRFGNTEAGVARWRMLRVKDLSVPTTV